MTTYQNGPPDPSTYDHWAGEFENDPLDSLQEEHARAQADEEVTLVPGPPSGATAPPYEGLLQALPEEDDVPVALPQPTSVTGKLSRVAVRHYYDDPVALPTFATAEEEADEGGFSMTREREEEFELPVPVAPAKQAAPRHSSSSFSLPGDEPAPAFGNTASDLSAEEYFGTELPNGVVLDPEDLGIDPNFRAMEVESAFAILDSDDELKVKVEIPAELRFLMGEEQNKGKSEADLKDMLREVIAEFMPPKPSRDPNDAYTEDDLDRIIQAMPEVRPAPPQVVSAPAVPPPAVVPQIVPAVPYQTQRQLARTQWDDRWAKAEADRRARARKLPWVRLLFLGALFYFFNWQNAISIAVIVGALWFAFTASVATLRWTRDTASVARYKARELMRR